MSFMFSPRNGTYNPNCQLKSLTHLVFMFQVIIFFRILRSWKARFHFAPFCPTRCVLKSFTCLAVNNRGRKWNEIKNFIYVGSKFQLFQLELSIFIYKLMCNNSLINLVSFLFSEFNRVASGNEGETIILVRS